MAAAEHQKNMLIMFMWLFGIINYKNVFAKQISCLYDVHIATHLFQEWCPVKNGKAVKLDRNTQGT